MKLLSSLSKAHTFLLSLLIATLTNANTTQQEQLDLLKQQVAALEKQINEQNRSAVSLVSQDKAVTIRIGGKVHAETTYFSDDKIDNPNGAEIRRAQIVIKGDFYNDWFWALENEFAGNSVTVTDALIGYQGLEHYTVLLGHFKEPFSFDFLTSDESNLFIEGASLNIFTPERSIGGSVSRHGENWSASTGIFGTGTGDSPTDDEGWGTTARITYAPIHENNATLHLGLAGTYRHTGGSKTLRYADKIVHQAAAPIVDTGDLAADNFVALGLEFASVYGPFAAQGRYVFSNVSRTSENDVSFDGYYIQASYALTGESMNYRAHNGTLRRIKPNNDFELKEDSWGAWEIALRYSNLDLNDGNVTGGALSHYAFGLNWYINNNARFMLNYTVFDADNNATTPGDSPSVLVFRSQFDF